MSRYCSQTQLLYPPNHLEPWGCHPNLRLCPGTRAHLSRKSQSNFPDQEMPSFSRLQLLLPLKWKENKSLKGPRQRLFSATFNLLWPQCPLTGHRSLPATSPLPGIRSHNCFFVLGLLPQGMPAAGGQDLGQLLQCGRPAAPRTRWHWQALDHCTSVAVLCPTSTCQPGLTQVCRVGR